MKKRNSILTIILLIIMVSLGILFILFATNTIKFNSDFGKNDTFSLSTESGQVDVLGYIEIKKVYNENNNEEVKYVFFNIVDTKNNDFLSYIENLKGNSFVSEKAIGLGCTDNNVINYSNDSDKYGAKAYQLSSDVSNKILNSTKDNPIKLRLNKMKLTEGTEAPTCYSHITTVEVID